MSYPYSIKEKEPILVCSDQDISYSIKEKEPTLVCSDQDMSYSIKEKGPNTGLLISGYVIPMQH